MIEANDNVSPLSPWNVLVFLSAERSSSLLSSEGLNILDIPSLDRVYSRITRLFTLNSPCVSSISFKKHVIHGLYTLRRF